jgi:hypothetical protein
LRKYTQVVVKSKDSGQSGFPKKIAIYHLGEARQTGNRFDVSVLVVMEKGLHISLPPAELDLTSADLAKERAIRHFRDFASKSELEIAVTELPELAR